MKTHVKWMVVVASASVLLIGCMFLVEDERSSHLEIQMPTMQYSESHDDSWYMLDGEKVKVYLVESAISNVQADGCSGYSNINVTFSMAMNTPKMNLEYGFGTLPGKSVPIPPVSTTDGSERASWVDPFSGHRLTMTYDGLLVERVVYDGTTIIEKDGGLHTVDFHLDVKYGTGDILLKHDITHDTVPDGRTFSVEGSAGDVPVSGTVRILPFSNTLNHSHDGVPVGNKLINRVNIDIDDVYLIGLPLELWVSTDEDFDFIRTFYGYSEVIDGRMHYVTYSIGETDDGFRISGSIEAYSVSAEGEATLIDTDTVEIAGVVG